MSACTNCARPMRPHGTRKEEAPGTVVEMVKGVCASCYGKRGGSAPAPVDIDTACVLVRTDLRPSTYRVLAAYAKEQHLDVGAVLSALADRAVRKPSRRRSGDEVDAQIRALNAQGVSDNRIAKQIGLAQSSVSRRRRLMRLEPPRPRSGGRQAKTAA